MLIASQNRVLSFQKNTLNRSCNKRRELITLTVNDDKSTINFPRVIYHSRHDLNSLYNKAMLTRHLKLLLYSGHFINRRDWYLFPQEIKSDHKIPRPSTPIFNVISDLSILYINNVALARERRNFLAWTKLVENGNPQWLKFKIKGTAKRDLLFAAQAENRERGWSLYGVFRVKYKELHYSSTLITWRPLCFPTRNRTHLSMYSVLDRITKHLTYLYSAWPDEWYIREQVEKRE